MADHYGWPVVELGEPEPQGDYYCGRNIGENIMKEHTDACIEAGVWYMWYKCRSDVRSMGISNRCRWFNSYE